MAKSAIDAFLDSMKPIAPARVAPVQPAGQMAAPESIDAFLANMKSIASPQPSPSQSASQMDVLKANMPSAWRNLNPVSGPASKFSGLEMLKNAPGDMWNVLGGIGGSLLHPVQTAENLGSLALGLGTQAGQAALPQGAQNAIAGQAPTWLRNAANQGVQTAQNFEGNLGTDYGSIPAIQQTLQNQPAKALMDASFLLGGAGGALRAVPGASAAGMAGKMSAAANAANPLLLGARAAAAPVRLAARQVAKYLPEDLPNTLYQQVSKFSTVADKNLGPGFRERITDTALQNRLTPTKGSVVKMYDYFNAIGDKMNAVADAAKGKRVLVSDLFDQVGAAANKLRSGFQGDRDAQIVQDVANAERLRFLRAGINDMTPGEVKKYKTSLQDKIKFSMTQKSAGYAKNEAMQALRRGAKAAEEKAMPNMIPLNQQWRALSELEPFLLQAAGRVKNRDLVGFAPLVLGAGGLGAGGPTAAMQAAASSYLLHPNVFGKLPIWMYHAQRNPLLQGLFPQAGPMGNTLRTLGTGLYQGGPGGLLQ